MILVSSCCQLSVCSVSSVGSLIKPWSRENKRACISGLRFLAAATGLVPILASGGGWAGLQHQRRVWPLWGNRMLQISFRASQSESFNTPNGALTSHSVCRRLREAFPAPWRELGTECAEKQNRKTPTSPAASHGKDQFLEVTCNIYTLWRFL